VSRTKLKPRDTLRDAAHALSVAPPPSEDIAALAEHFESMSDIDLAVSWMPCLAEHLHAAAPEGGNRPLILVLNMINQRLIDPPGAETTKITAADVRNKYTRREPERTAKKKDGA
jgi:hypothetical protein